MCIIYREQQSKAKGWHFFCNEPWSKHFWPCLMVSDPMIQLFSLCYKSSRRQYLIQPSFTYTTGPQPMGHSLVPVNFCLFSYSLRNLLPSPTTEKEN